MSKSREMREKANRFFESGNVAEAILCYEEALQDDPDCSKTHVNLSYVRWQAGDLEAGIEQLENYLESQEGANVSPEIRVNLALLKGAAEDFEGSLDQIKKAQAGKSQIPQIYGAGAEILQQKGDMPEAKEILDKGVQLFEDNVELLNTAGSFYCDVLADYDSAIVLFNSALKIQPKYAVVLNNLGIALVGVARYSEAIEKFERAMQLDAAYTEPYENMAVALFKSGNYAKAANILGSAIEKFSESARSVRWVDLQEEALEMAASSQDD